jgi:hypothetical protein
MAGACIITRNNAAVLKSIFPLQSFFDNTQLHNAILTQDPGATGLIVGTPITQQVSGRIIGLHPHSQLPVMTTMKGVEGAVTLGLTPGQVVKGPLANGFQSVTWGLPFGWLGGGLAKLIVADEDDSMLIWPEAAHEVLLQRVRLKIVADANPSTSPNAWTAALPLRFPWKNAFRYNTALPGSPIPQNGLAEFAAVPTRLVLRLRVSTLAVPTTMRVILQGIDDFDLGSDGSTIAYTDFTSFDVTWPAASGTSTPYPVLELRDGVGLFRGDAMIVTLSDLGAATLTNQYVDILSYGNI